jgi:FXSXX-COOH protein
MAGANGNRNYRPGWAAGSEDNWKRAYMAENDDQSAGRNDPVPGGGLLDLSDTPLHELLCRDRDDTVLVRALRRVTTEASRRRGDAVSAFGSSVFLTN